MCCPFLFCNQVFSPFAIFSSQFYKQNNVIFWGNIKVIILKGGKMMLKKILNSFVALSIAVVMLFGLNVNAQNNNNNNDNNGITRVATTGDVTDDDDDTDWGWIGLLGLAGLLGLRRRNDRKD